MIYKCMRPHKRHTELTHHILHDACYDPYYWYYEDDNDYGYYDEPYLEYEYIKIPVSGVAYKRNRWFKNILHKYKKIEDPDYILQIDMMSIYSKERKRDITIGKIFGEENDCKNTIENLINPHS